MPDVKVRYPRTMLFTSKREMQDLVATSVAEFLSCEDYKDEPMLLSQKDIDVHLMPYERGQVSPQGMVVFVEIIGYDYPSRMEKIKDHLTSIKEDLAIFLVERANSPFDPKKITVCFIPIPDGCWV
jgi:hypothetical protein